MHQSRNIYSDKKIQIMKRKKMDYIKEKREKLTITVRAFNIYFRVSNTTSRQKCSTSDQYNQPD